MGLLISGRDKLEAGEMQIENWKMQNSISKPRNGGLKAGMNMNSRTPN
jgi:hypothetical protein